MATKAKVGRPKGKARKVTDAQRIRNVLLAEGLTTPTAKVKTVLKRNLRKTKEGAARLEDKAMDVKIAQVRSKLIAEQTGIVREGRGRRTKEQAAEVAKALEAA
jgi:ribosomal protein L24